VDASVLSLKLFKKPFWRFSAMKSNKNKYDIAMDTRAKPHLTSVLKHITKTG